MYSHFKRVFLIFLALLLSLAAGCSCAGGKADAAAPTRVSYLGPEGTYTQEACETFFGEKVSLLPYPAAPGAVSALLSDEADYAVIPQENTIGGAVNDYLDLVIGNRDVSVAGEVELPISQNLLVLPGTSLGDIKTVYSHPQAIAQSEEWRKEHLPDARVIEVSSTAEGASVVAKSGDRTCAAVASAGCAPLYGLEILARDIQNSDSNKTRFYVLTLKAPGEQKADRFAFVAEGNAKDLPALMKKIQNRKITLVAIHDRPRKTGLGEYRYLIECEGGYRDYRKLVKGLDAFEFRYLGSFSVR